MTLIAAVRDKGKWIVGADTLCSNDTQKFYTSTDPKIRQFETDNGHSCIVGFAGSTSVMSQIWNECIWTMDGPVDEKWVYASISQPYIMHKDISLEGLVVTRGDAYYIDSDGGILKLDQDFIAIGSGSLYAYGYYNATMHGGRRFLTEMFDGLKEEKILPDVGGTYHIKELT